MSSQPTCPCCHSSLSIQRVAAIVAGGTQQVRGITASLMPAAGVAHTNLAQLLAPPHQPGGGWLIIALLFGLLLLSVPASCVTTAVIVELQGQSVEAAFTSGVAEHIVVAVIGVAALVSVAIIAGITQLRERSRRAATAQWNRQMARWQQSWYCHRCHATFVAGSSKAVAPEQFGLLLAV